ncbi:MAG TPA: hypothetical protein ENI32_02255 [Candidatus Syntrophoarchaeum butanivorans]|uniref:Heat-shock protein n=1 Tax=Candidatus Syntropharchaeum butanivorans TaxID=1839936 RepID=A0A7J2S032_9EURY|nr:hypothetical protein [Candidatus Syntrophoarchaeum butanivorans]
MIRGLVNKIIPPLLAASVLAVFIVTIASGIRYIALNGAPFNSPYILLILAVMFVTGSVLLGHENDLKAIVRGSVFSVLTSFLIVALIGGVVSFVEDPPVFSLLISAISICMIVSAIILRVFIGFTSS